MKTCDELFSLEWVTDALMAALIPNCQSRRARMLLANERCTPARPLSNKHITVRDEPTCAVVDAVSPGHADQHHFAIERSAPYQQSAL